MREVSDPCKVVAQVIRPLREQSNLFALLSQCQRTQLGDKLRWVAMVIKVSLPGTNQGLVFLQTQCLLFNVVTSHISVYDKYSSLLHLANMKLFSLSHQHLLSFLSAVRLLLNSTKNILNVKNILF